MSELKKQPTGELLDNKPKTNYRWVIIFMLWLLYLINYFDRTAVLTFLPFIREDLSLTHQQVGVAASVFFFAYAVAQILAGWLADKIGSKKVMGIAIFVFTFVTFVTGLVKNFTQFFLIRLGLGLGEGHHFAPANRCIADWFPNKEKGRAASILATTWAVGPAIIPITVTALAAAFGSWRPVFYVLAVPGALGIFCLFYWVFNNPREAMAKGRCSLEEVKYIEEGLTEGLMKEGEKFDTKKALGIIFRDKSFICYCLMLFCALAIYWGSTTWISSFLYEQHGFSMQTMGALVSLPYAVAMISMMFGGTLMDKFFKSKAKPVLLLSFIPAIPILFYLGSIEKGNVSLLVTVLVLNGFFVNLFWGVIYAYPQIRYPREMVGTAVGVSNGFGQLGSFMAPLVAGYLVYESAGVVYYTNVFIFFAGLAVLAGVLALFLNEKPLDMSQITERKAS